MNLVFLVHRTNYYKFYGPVIKVALQRGWNVECWLFQEKQGKKYLVPTEENLPYFGIGNVACKVLREEEVASQLNRGTSADAIISLHPKERYANKFKTSPVFVTLQHGIDTFIETSLKGLISTDMLCFYSPYWTEWGAHYYADNEGVQYQDAIRLLETKAVYTGFPQMDEMEAIDPDAVYKKYGIKPDRPVILLLPITLSNIGGAWPRFFESESRRKQISSLWRGAKNENWQSALSYWQWVINGWNDKVLTEAIGRFSARNHATLIAKGRGKDQIRPWLANQANLALYDESYFPPTILELLAISDVCIHFYSFAALESAYAGVYGITVDRPSPGEKLGTAPPIYHRLWRQHLKGTAFNFPGVNKWITIPDAIRQLPKTNLDTLRISEAERTSYVETYLGQHDAKASDRILDRVEMQVNQKTIKASSMVR